MIVVDTNLIVALLLEGPNRELAEAVLARDPHWTAPPLWRSEFRNVLVLAVRHAGLALAATDTYSARAQELMKGRELAVEDDSVMRLAAASGCTTYDCEFVALAESLGVALVTFDREVLAAFPTTAIHPELFASHGFWGDRVSEAVAAFRAAAAPRHRAGQRSGRPSADRERRTPRRRAA